MTLTFYELQQVYGFTQAEAHGAINRNPGASACQIAAQELLERSRREIALRRRDPLFACVLPHQRHMGRVLVSDAGFDRAWGANS